jgi:PAS domain S-box-containing protein
MQGGGSGDPSAGPGGGAVRDWSLAGRAGEALERLADVSDEVFWMMDARTRAIVYVSSAYERVWKRSIPELVGDSRAWHAHVEPEDAEKPRRALAALLRDGLPFEVSYRMTDGEGRQRWAYERAWAVRDAAGEIESIIGIVRDATSEKVALDHQRLVLREMNHRVKNTLATVVSIARQTAATAPDLDVFLESFNARVLAFSGAHDLLMQNAWTSVPLNEVISRTLAPYMQRDAQRIRVDGPIVLLPHDPSVALNLVFHELATNAVKYGALSKPAGQVSVTWALETWGGTGILDLRWEETGGPPVPANTRRGFGSRLIKRTLAVLGGRAEVNLAPSGFDCWISLPLPEPSIQTDPF